MTISSQGRDPLAGPKSGRWQITTGNWFGALIRPSDASEDNWKTWIAVVYQPSLVINIDFMFTVTTCYLWYSPTGVWTPITISDRTCHPHKTCQRNWYHSQSSRFHSTTTRVPAVTSCHPVTHSHPLSPTVAHCHPLSPAVTSCHQALSPPKMALVEGGETRYIPPPPKNKKNILDILKLRFLDNPCATLFNAPKGKEIRIASIFKYDSIFASLRECLSVCLSLNGGVAVGESLQGRVILTLFFRCVLLSL